MVQLQDEIRLYYSQKNNNYIIPDIVSVTIKSSPDDLTQNFVVEIPIHNTVIDSKYNLIITQSQLNREIYQNNIKEINKKNNIKINVNESGNKVIDYFSDEYNDLINSNNSSTTDDKSVGLGSKISVFLSSYDFNTPKFRNYTHINGYITNFEFLENTIKIHCEDEFYVFKSSAYTKRVKKAWSGVTLKEIVYWMIGDSNNQGNCMVNGYRCNYDINVIDMFLDNFTIGDDKSQLMTAAEIFKLLQENLQIKIFFRDNIFYVGHKFWYPLPNYSSYFKFSQFFKDGCRMTFDEKIDVLLSKPESYQVVGYGKNVLTNKIKIFKFPNDNNIYDNKIEIKLPTYDDKTIKSLIKEAYNNLGRGKNAGSFKVFGDNFLHGDHAFYLFHKNHVNGESEIGDGITYYINNLEFEYKNGFHCTITLGNPIQLALEKYDVDFTPEKNENDVDLIKKGAINVKNTFKKPPEYVLFEGKKVKLSSIPAPNASGTPGVF